MTFSVRLALSVLSTYRLSRMVAYEEGPFRVFDRARASLGGYDLGINGEPITAMGRLVTCPFCVGVYVSLLFALLSLRPSRLGDMSIAWMGISGGQDLLQEIVNVS